jgi:hypothetical protein
VEAVRHWGLGNVTSSDSWCGFMAIGFVLDIVFAGESPFPRQEDINGSTQAALAYARAQGWIVPLSEAVPGDLIFSVHDDGTPHHVAMIEETAPALTTIAGNTSADGLSSNGDRVAEHIVSSTSKVCVHYPRGSE